MPPPPLGSDGFAHGMAAIVGSGINVLSLGLATVSVVLPTLLGRDGPLGFDRLQRLTLKGVGGLIGGGLVVEVAFGFVTIPPFGVLLWLVFVALAAVVVVQRSTGGSQRYSFEYCPEPSERVRRNPRSRTY